MEVDTVDYAVLKVVEDDDKPLWKNRIHEVLTDRIDELPEVNEVSVQTVGRRVDRLRDEEYLSSCIISPDEIKRDLIIAFKLTDKGEAAIKEKREEFLRETVRSQIFADQNQAPEKPVLVELIWNHFSFDSDIKHRLVEEYTQEELSTFLTLYYVKRKVADVFTDESAEKLADLAQQSKEMEAALGNNKLENKISDKLDIPEN